ncbi:MAG: peptidase [Nitrosopumilales archaeon]|nr:peptidase [Nitrosopumilales archaeon]
MYKLIILFAISGLCFVPLLVDNVYGHGLGMDMAPPISFAGMDVTVSTILNPADITVGDIINANMAIRFFDTKTDQNLKSVTYRVEIWRSGELLARNLFYDTDGELNVKLRPKSGCTEADLWKCSTYYGFPDPISGGLTAQGSEVPVITGPIFDKGGLYNIRVQIEGATSPKTQVAEVLNYDTFVSIAQKQNFFIQNAQAQQIPVTVKTYYDDVENFKFDSKDSSISFDMPFNWDPNYVKQVQVVHEEIHVPKSFASYAEGKQFKGLVDGVQVDNRVLLIDPYSYEDTNVIHFLVSGTELQRINSELGMSHHTDKTISFKLLPLSTISKNSFEIKFDSGATATISWDSSYGAGDKIPFEISFFDVNGKLLKDIHYGFTITDKNNKELYSNVGTDPKMPGIMASEGLDIQQLTIPLQDIHKINLAIFGQGINYDQKYAGIASGIFEVGPGTKSVEISIPDWVRSNAGWWSSGQISDKDFASGIEFMIKNGIIKVPVTSSGSASTSVTIPDWVRSNAGWWSSGQISDKDFASGIQYLVANGIIKV